MKKNILLLALPLSVLIAADFTMTPKGLFPETTIEVPIVDTTPEESNTYLEPVNLPKCDADNPEVQLIRSNADWKTINNIRKSIFCVSPGDYRTLGKIKVTVDGTAKKRRYIVLNNGNNLHPGKLSTDQRANYILQFNSASYWTIDRQSSVGSISRAIHFKNGSSFNIVNKMFTGGGIGTSVTIGNNSNNNTIQNSRFTEQNTPSDMVAINIIDFNIDSFSSKNNKIINNEFVNQNDGFQITRLPQPDEPAVGGVYQSVNAEGTIVDSNTFYLTQEAQDMENAIDLKAGSDNPSNPVLITNNKMWGYNKGKGHGRNAFVAHYTTKNIKIKNNVIFNSNKAFATGSNGSNSTFRLGTVDGEMTGNLFYNCGSSSEKTDVFSIGSSHNFNIHSNTIIEGNYKVGTFTNLRKGTVFSKNILVDSTENFYEASNDTTFTNSRSTTYTERRGLYSKDLIFSYDNFTNNPKTMRLENVLKP